MLAVLALLTLAVGTALVGSQNASAQSEPERVAFDQDLVITEGDIVHGDVSVTNGNLTIYGTVEGKATVMNGHADIYGKVQGDVAVLTGGGVTLHEKSTVGGNVLASGDIKLLDKSTVNGSVTAFGGRVEQSENATVRGSVSTMDNPAVALQNLVQPNQPIVPGKFDGPFSNSPFARITGIFTIGILSLMVLLLSVGMTAAIPNRVRTSSATLQAQPAPSIVMGVIAAFLIFPVAGLVAVLLTISVVGIVLLPVLAVALAGAFLMGFVVVAHWLGKHLHDTTRQVGQSFLPYQSPTLMLEVLLGVAVILACTLIPALFLPAWISALMFLLLYAIACIGIGSTILSKFGTLAPPRRQHPHKIIYPTPAHNHYGAVLQHHSSTSPLTVSASAERTNTRPLGQAPALPRDE